MKKKWQKYKKFILDLLVNTFSFAIYILAQQLIFMPIMDKMLSEKSFATFIIFISIFSIISNSLGSELGTVRQVLEQKKNTNEYNKILRYLLVFVFIISIICISFLGYSLVDNLMLSLVILLANIRLYASACFRMNKDFKKVMVQNLLYLIGILFGLFLYTKIRIIWIPSLTAEIFCLLYSFIKTDLNKLFVFSNVKIKKKTITSFKDYSLIQLLINMMTYFDKIMIYPILGSSAVAIYYSTTTMSKIVALITNPLHGVIISWLKVDDKKTRDNIIKQWLKIALPIIIVVTLISLPLTYIAIMVLYKKYLSEALIIIIPISIGVGVSFCTSIIKAILFKYTKSTNLLRTYISYLLIFVFLSIIMSNYLKLLGFALANLFSKVILLIMFLITLKRIIKRDDSIDEKKS